MSRQQFDLNDQARQKINEQYEYADERLSEGAGAERLPKKKKNSCVRNAPEGEKPEGYRKKTVRSQTGTASRKKAKAADKKRKKAPAPPGELRAEVYIDEPLPETPQTGGSHGKLLIRFRKFAVFIIIFGILYIAVNFAFLYYRGMLWFNEPRKRDYPVRGAAVCSDLGTVDWELFQYQQISFAYVRATKGTHFVDDQFAANRKGIDETRLSAGYYHEFDFSADGAKQAEHYIETVGSLDGDLRPAVKLTAYGIYGIKMKDTEKVRTQLHAFLRRIKEEYGRRAVVMCDNDCYKKYIKPFFSDQTLWIIDHFGEPDKDMSWALWEFNPRVRSEGYSNNKQYYPVTVYRLGKDMNNFRKNFEIGYE